MEFIKARLREASTWRGLILLATIAGAKLSPEQTEAIVTFGVTLVATIGVFFPDKKTEATETTTTLKDTPMG